MTSALNIVESGYRATVEEQDDTILWLSSMFKGAGLDVTVLLRSSAVNYAVRGQDASGLTIGGKTTTSPPRLDDDLAALLDKGVPVYYLAEDAAALGLDPARFVDGIKAITVAELPDLFAASDHVWHW